MTMQSKRTLLIAVAILFLIGGVAAIPAWKGLLVPSRNGKEGAADPKSDITVGLVDGKRLTLTIPDSVKESLGITEPMTVAPPKGKRELVLPGSTALDPTRLMRIRTRFNAEVVEIGPIRDKKRLPVRDEQESLKTGRTVWQELRTGNTVEKGDVLAVLWSIDVGGKKSDLVDALVQLRLDEKRLKAREELFLNGSIPEDTLNQTKRDVISDRNAVDRAERTLRTWNIPEAEIEVVRDEAEKASQREGKRDKEKERLWARSQLIAPRDGTIVERNIGIGEYVADNTINLFTIADLDRLLVVAYAPEDLLPDLMRLEPRELFWTIKTVGVDGVTGPIEEIGQILDPNQHTAVIKGYVPNPKDVHGGGKIRAGQFVSATIQLRAPKDVVEVPLTALAEDGRQSFVFVQEPAEPSHFTMRRVVVSHRFEKIAYVRSRLSEEEQDLKPEESKQGLQPRRPLDPRERILTTGVLELRAALEDQLSKAKQQ